MKDLRSLHDTWDGTSEYVKINCLLPGHIDEKPSYAVYSDHAYCYACNSRVNYANHIRLVGKEPTKEVSVFAPKPVIYTPDELYLLACDYVTQLHDYGKSTYLLNRGLSLATIKRFRLGYLWNKGFSIPVWDYSGTIRTIRFRRDPALGEGEPKYWGIKGMNKPTLFSPIGFLEGTEVVWTEGEFDAILACQLGYSGISMTNGVDVDPNLFIPILKEHDIPGVGICFDNDKVSYAKSLALAKKLSEADIAYRFIRFRQKDLTELVVAVGEDEARRVVNR